VGAHAADVLALMTRLGIDRAVIAGLSMGGYIALALMRAAPHRAAGLVLANTRATADSEEGRASRDRMIALAERDGAAGVAREMIPKLLGPSSRAAQPRLEHTVRRLIEANTSAGITAALRAMKARPDSSALLPSIACPTLIVSGNEDALVPEPDVQAMAMSIPGARRQVMAGAGHLTNLEAPDAFNDALAAFLAGPAGGAARA
jgi:pimeloyl-ACP methyl ester carboxylesterase